MSCFPKQFEQVIRSFSAGEISRQLALVDRPVHTTNNFMCVDWVAKNNNRCVLKGNENNVFLFPTLQANHVCSESSLALINLFLQVLWAEGGFLIEPVYTKDVR